MMITIITKEVILVEYNSDGNDNNNSGGYNGDDSYIGNNQASYVTIVLI